MTQKTYDETNKALTLFEAHWFKPVTTFLLAICGWFTIQTYTINNEQKALMSKSIEQLVMLVGLHDKRLSLIEQSRTEGMARYQVLERRVEDLVITVTDLKSTLGNVEAALNRKGIH